VIAVCSRAALSIWLWAVLLLAVPAAGFAGACARGYDRVEGCGHQRLFARSPRSQGDGRESALASPQGLRGGAELVQLRAGLVAAL
jgi:hypothetical protein